MPLRAFPEQSILSIFPAVRIPGVELAFLFKEKQKGFIAILPTAFRLTDGDAVHDAKQDGFYAVGPLKTGFCDHLARYVQSQGGRPRNNQAPVE